ncbi:MAG: cytochrome c peroxidase [Pseudomonadota bacterium]
MSVPAPITDGDFLTFAEGWAEAGQLLFFDPVLSGNKNIACATCHHPTLATGDAMSLSIGEGGLGLGTERVPVADNMPGERIPRNAPALFNLGAREFSVMFHDGRVERDAASPFGIRMPEGRTLPAHVPAPLSAQNILPILSPAEMSGQPGENEVADAVAAENITGPDGAWAILTQRIDEIPAYAEAFDALIGTERDLQITDIATALSAFITHEFRATESKFDLALRGDAVMSSDETEGLLLFYGKANCATCHSGPFLTDHRFHAIGMPQLGPGKSKGDAAYRDSGRGMVTGDYEDDYRFRTPSLRNVALTAPYGHNGAYTELEEMIRHHLDPKTALDAYTESKATLHALEVEGDDYAAMKDAEEVERIREASEITPVTLTDEEVDQILAFLNTLTDDTPLTGRLGVPASVPSGLPLDPVSASVNKGF